MPDFTKDLDALLAQGPSKKTWNGLLKLFDRWRGDPDFPAGIERARTVVDGWPSALKSHDNRVTFAILALKPPLELSLLRHLDIAGQRLTEDHIKPLARSKLLGSITHMNLGHNRFGAEGLRALLQSGSFGSCEDLALSSTPIGPDGAKALAGAEGNVFKRLNLFSTAVGDDGAAALAASRNLSSLEELDLSFCKIGVAGAKALATAKGLTALKKLSLFANRIGSGGILSFIAEGFSSLPSLTWLNVGDCSINDKGILALAATPPPARLRTLKLSTSGVSASAMRALKKSWGKRVTS